jgi:HSP20 family protein
MTNINFKTITMRTLRNNPGFLVNFPSILNEVLASDMQKESFINQGAQPLVNILENEEQFEIEVLAPGFLKENFGLKVEENKLVISAKLKEATEANEKNYSLREFYKKPFTRTFNLPKEKINEDEIKANYFNGILQITLPKREEAKPKAPKAIEIL